MGKVWTQEEKEDVWGRHKRGEKTMEIALATGRRYNAIVGVIYALRKERDPGSIKPFRGERKPHCPHCGAVLRPKATAPNDRR